MIRLENWSVVSGGGSPYDPPECQKISLKGEVYGYPRFDDGEKITTSYVKNVDGRVVTTNNTIYTLGEVDLSYAEWCQANGCHVPTPEQPIKLK